MTTLTYKPGSQMEEGVDVTHEALKDAMRERAANMETVNVNILETFVASINLPKIQLRKGATVVVVDARLDNPAAITKAATAAVEMGLHDFVCIDMGSPEYRKLKGIEA